MLLSSYVRYPSFATVVDKQLVSVSDAKTVTIETLLSKRFKSNGNAITTDRLITNRHLKQDLKMTFSLSHDTRCVHCSGKTPLSKYIFKTVPFATQRPNTCLKQHCLTLLVGQRLSLSLVHVLYHINVVQLPK